MTKSRTSRRQGEIFPFQSAAAPKTPAAKARARERTARRRLAKEVLPEIGDELVLAHVIEMAAARLAKVASPERLASVLGYVSAKHCPQVEAPPAAKEAVRVFGRPRAA